MTKSSPGQTFNLEEIQERMNKNLPQPKEPKSSANRLDSENLPSDHPLWELWSRMGEIFGHQWSSQQGAAPNDTWVRGLVDLTPENLATGLTGLLDRTDKWPPNLVEFRRICTHPTCGGKNWEQQAHKPFDSSRAIEQKHMTMKARQVELAKLRDECGV